ncbi:MAG: hypothetical protein ACRENW_01790, partial [Thermodesulfobacteriota bacterium]
IGASGLSKGAKKNSMTIEKRIGKLEQSLGVVVEQKPVVLEVIHRRAGGYTKQVITIYPDGTRTEEFKDSEEQ